mgnify:CR=1 FL=1
MNRPVPQLVFRFDGGKQAVGAKAFRPGKQAEPSAVAASQTFGELRDGGSQQLGAADKGARLCAFPYAVPVPAGHPHSADRRHADRNGVRRVRAAAVRQRPEVLQTPTEAGIAQMRKQSHTDFGARHRAASAEHRHGRHGAGNMRGPRHAAQVLHRALSLVRSPKTDINSIRAGLGDDVFRRAAADAAAVVGDGVGTAPLLQRQNLISRLPNGADALGVIHTGMRGPAADIHAYLRDALPLHHGLVPLAAFADEGGGAVLYVRLQKGDPVVAGQPVADLLVRRKEQPQRAGKTKLLQRVHCQQRNGNAALAVHNAGTVQAALGCGLQTVGKASRRVDGVQMGHKTNRRRHASGFPGDDEPAACTGKRMLLDRETQFLCESGCQLGGKRNALPIKRKALLRGQSGQKVLKTVFLRFDAGKKCRDAVQKNPSFRISVIQQLFGILKNPVNRAGRIQPLGQQRRADQSGLPVERGDFNKLRVGAALPNAGEQVLPFPKNTADQYNPVGSEDCRQVVESDRKMLRIRLQDGVRNRAAGPRRVEGRPAVDDARRLTDPLRQRAFGEVVRRFPRHPAERGGGGVLLPAADPAAAAGTAVHHHDHMSELAGAVFHTEVDFPAEADSAADPRANRNHKKIIRIPARAGKNLPVKSTVGVVFQIHGQTQPL